ncbi:nucleotidyltransferase family protein [Sphingomonas sp.]|jgi:hypothetical protein|uniref:nucleotidyltransferase family protein n=1 Tax=Sphingomonas sp. TaxID=28214 RepID=UPI002E2FC702|nr:nucleotidyltransferase family protein [Sphingomonas sp.]HEX4695459.1 nucleotidyltransferase family protein [Sphingomonas sp.]
MTSLLPQYELAPGEFARRKEWARRRGSPNWLWPEVDPVEWRAALTQLEGIARNVVNGRSASLIEGEPAALSLAAYTSGLGPLVGWWLHEGAIDAPAGVRSTFDMHLSHNRLRNERLLSHGRQIAAAFAAQKIDLVVLKGAHTALSYFPDRATRPASDVDLLIRERDAGAAAGVLQSLGLARSSGGRFESNWRPVGASTEPRSLSFVHEDDPWSIDLHYSLDRYVDAGAPRARLDLGDSMHSSRPWQGLASARVLDQPLLLLALAVHAGTGLHSLTLLRLVELIFVIRKDTAEGRLSWLEFLARAERTNSTGYAFPALALCAELAPGIVPDDVLDACFRAAPPRARAVVSRHTPSSAHRVDRNSLAEHFMWTRGLGGWTAKLASDIAPSARWGKVRSIYLARLWQLARGRVAR